MGPGPHYGPGTSGTHLSKVVFRGCPVTHPSMTLVVGDDHHGGSASLRAGRAARDPTSSPRSWPFGILTPGIVSALESCLGLLGWPSERRTGGGRDSRAWLRTWRSPPGAPNLSPRPDSQPQSSGAGKSRWAPRTEPRRWRLTWTSDEEAERYRVWRPLPEPEPADRGTSLCPSA